MLARARSATFLLSVAVVLVIGAALARSFTRTVPFGPCGAATDASYVREVAFVARRLYAEELTGHAVHRATATIEANATLAAAVRSGDRATARHEVIVLLYNHEHIVRLRVTRGARVIADVGGAKVLAPVHGVLRIGGVAVGRFTFTVQDDMGYRLLAKRLIGAYTVMSAGGRVVMADIATGSLPLRDGGSVTVAGRTYLVAKIDARRMPSGRLGISLLVPRPPAALARESCAAVRAGVLSSVVHRVYHEAFIGPNAGSAISAVEHSRALLAAVEADDRVAARAAALRLVTRGTVKRIEVRRGGRLLAAAGPRSGLIAPISGTLRDGAGTAVGSFAVSLQSARGVIAVAEALTGTPLVVRSGSQTLALIGRVPATLPSSGIVSFGGRSYAVGSFVGERFPRGALRISVLAPASGS